MTAMESAAPTRRRIGGLPGFAAATIALIAAGAGALTLVFTGPGDARAIWLSAVVAAVSQIAAFPAVRKLTASNLMVGWGIGTLVRFLTLLAYALVGAFVLALPMTPALVSLALFYFMSMVIEPLFLRS
jgi:hypothetical protein